MKNFSEVVLGLAFLVAGWVAVGVVEAVPGSPLTYQEVAREVMSPACPGRLLIDCTSGEADQLRELVRQKIVQGQTKSQIIDDLVDMYGVSILASPPKKGFFLAAWALPFLAILYGIVMLLLSVKALTRKKGATLPGANEVKEKSAQSEASDPYRERLEKELSEFEY